MTRVNSSTEQPTAIRFRVGKDGPTRVWAAVPSRSHPGVTHVVCLNARTGEARHAENDCRCAAARFGRPCWHVDAVIREARAAGIIPPFRMVLPADTPSVFDRAPRRDREEEI